MRTVPLAFGFTAEAKVSAALQVRAALKSVLDHCAAHDDLAVLVRVALYCNAMCVKMIKGGSFESDGLADAAEAVTAGMTAVNSVIDRLNRTGKIGASGPERGQLAGLVDAYEAMFNAATRRESVEALAQIPAV